MLHLAALVGVLSISFSAIFVRLAAVSPVTATFYRAAYAVPVLAVLVLAGLRHRSMRLRSARERWLAFASGLILTIDLNLWHESIALLGAGLGTVIANVQVVFVAAAAWLFHAERPAVRTIWTIAVVLGGVVLTSGLGRPDAYGANPTLGALLAVTSGVCYAAFLLVFRASNRTLAPTAGPLFESTVGMMAGALASAPLDRHFTLAPALPAHLWLALLALVSQVFGWLLIATALPRLPAVETSVLLLGQPVLAVVWGVLLFGERLSALQWIGSAVVLVGVAATSLAAAHERA